jgi:hypothetical protein
MLGVARRSVASLETPHLKAWRADGAEFIVDRKVEIVTPEKVDKL